MVDAVYFRRKAEQCRSLADIAINREIVEALDELAHEFETKAAEVALPPRRASDEATPRRIVGG